MLFKIICFVMCMIGIAYGVNAIRVRRIRFVLWTMREPELSNVRFWPIVDVRTGRPAAGLRMSAFDP